MLLRRRSLATLVVAVSLITTPLPAANTLTPGDIRQGLFSTCFISDKEGWVAGELGRVFYTDNGGETFTRSQTNTERGLLALSCFPDKTLVIVGQLGLVMRSRDGGGTWETLQTGTKHSLLSVDFGTPQTGIAVGDFGTILQTEDGGSTWTKVSLPTEVKLPEDVAEVVEPGDVLVYDVAFADPQHAVAVGEFGTIFLTSDAGKTWESMTSPVEGTLFGVGFADPQNGWAVGLESTMVRTTDGGRTWTQVPVAVRKDFFLSLYDVAVEGQVGWAIGDRGLLVQSLDGGATWKEVQVPIRLAGNWFRGVDLRPSGSGFIVGNRGMMLTTKGDQFHELKPQPTTERVSANGQG